MGILLLPELLGSHVRIPVPRPVVRNLFIRETLAKPAQSNKIKRTVKYRLD